MGVISMFKHGEGVRRRAMSVLIRKVNAFPAHSPHPPPEDLSFCVRLELGSIHVPIPLLQYRLGMHIFNPSTLQNRTQQGE